MKFFNNLKIGVRITIGFLLVAIIAAVIGIIGIVNLQSIDGSYKVAYTDSVNSMEYLERLSSSYQRSRVNFYGLVLAESSEDIDFCMNTMDEYSKNVEEEIAAYRDLLSSYVAEEVKTELELIDAVQATINAYNEKRNEFVKKYATDLNRRSEAAKQLGAGSELRKLGEDVDNAITELIAYNIDYSDKQIESNGSQAAGSMAVMFVGIAVGLALAIIVGLFISRGISKRINYLVMSSEKIADGDINVRIEADTKDEIGVLAGAYLKIITAIKEMLREVEKLTKAAENGQLSVRGDAGSLSGCYADIINGFNKTMDVISVPLGEAGSILNRMAVNDYTEKMTGQYRGEFKEFADDINTVLSSVLSVQDALVRIGKGDISRIEEFKEIGQRSDNDKLMPAAIAAMSSIRSIIDETGKIADSAEEGDLSQRGKVDLFEGGYKRIIQGINKTMDLVEEPIAEVDDIMQKLAHKDLTVHMTGEYKGGFAKMKDAINSTIDSFNEMMNEINSAAEQVASGSKQISDSSIALSQGATEQASSIEELTASLEEISSQTKMNADNANKANDLAGNARTNAVQGNTQMKEMLKAMDEINVSSNNINKIIKVIDDIAFQTNILALNAAVEAARAGQHGKGFAVVAEEVRTLAARSADAAKETTEMIEGSINKVEAGTRIAKDTANALGKIVDEVEKAANLVNDIAIASNEQATGIGQINQGIMQVSEVVQTNSATSEESAAASEELTSQAELLKEMVSQIKIKKNSKAYNKLEEINPEVLKMLENMTDKGKDKGSSKPGAAESSGTDSKKPNGSKEKKIVLNDKEFGKY